MALALLSLLFSSSTILIFVHARAVPLPTDAPQVRQKAPDFSLLDTNNQTVSLAQLSAPAPGDAAAGNATGGSHPRRPLKAFLN